MIEFRPKLLMDKPALLVLIGKDQIEQKTWLNQLPGELKSALSSLTQGQVFKAEKGEIFPVVQKNRTVLFVGLGAKAPGFLTTLRVAVRQALASEFIKTVREVELAAFFAEDAEIIAVIEGVLIGTYTWDKYRSVKNDECPPRARKVFLVVKEKKSFAEAVMVCEGVTLARDLVNDNADVVQSETFEEAVFSMCRGCKQASIKILNEEELKEKGLNLHLAVNKGSPYPPKLIIVKYRGASREARTTALVGK
ncbi:MAG TPA: M17 family peptidase N-terminal domain-containing protein, partial [Candidatus Omnitrophota bacterium]|nr:M17 family peptidase N-terminal domain-containing protein [Candidatus Omnitrophota bacterium]